MNIQQILSAILVSAIWGGNFVVAKIAFSEFSPIFYCCARFFLVAFPFIFFVKRPQISWKIIAGIGVSIGCLNFTLTFLGLHVGTPAGLASLLMQVQVFFTVGLSALLFKTAINRRQYVGMFISFLGILFIALRLPMGGALLGMGFIVASGLFLSIGSLLFRLAKGADMFSLTIWMSLIPPLPLFALSLGVEGSDIIQTTFSNLSWVGISCLLYTVCFATWIACTLWGHLFSQCDPSLVAPYGLLIPVFGIIFSTIFLGENLPLETFGACTLILVGLILNQWRSGSRSPAENKPTPPPKHSLGRLS